MVIKENIDNSKSVFQDVCFFLVFKTPVVVHLASVNFRTLQFNLTLNKFLGPLLFATQHYSIVSSVLIKLDHVALNLQNDTPIRLTGIEKSLN